MASRHFWKPNAENPSLDQSPKKERLEQVDKDLLRENVFDALMPDFPEQARLLQEEMEHGEWILAPSCTWEIRELQASKDNPVSSTIECEISLWDAISYAGLTILPPQAVEQMKKNFVRLSGGCQGTRIKLSFWLPDEIKEKLSSKNERGSVVNLSTDEKRKYKEIVAHPDRVGAFYHGWAGNINVSEVQGAEFANQWMYRLRKISSPTDKVMDKEHAYFMRVVGLGIDEANFAQEELPRLRKEGYGSDDYARFALLVNRMTGFQKGTHSESQRPFTELYGHSMGGAMLTYLKGILRGDIRFTPDLCVMLAAAYHDPQKREDPNKKWTSIETRQLLAMISDLLLKAGLAPKLRRAADRVSGVNHLYRFMEKQWFTDAKMRTILRGSLQDTRLAHRDNVTASADNMEAVRITQIGGSKNPGSKEGVIQSARDHDMYIYFEGDQLVNEEEAIQQYVVSENREELPMVFVLNAIPYVTNEGKTQLEGDHYGYQYQSLREKTFDIADMKRFSKDLRGECKNFFDEFFFFRKNQIQLRTGNKTTEEAIAIRFLQEKLVGDNAKDYQESLGQFIGLTPTQIEEYIHLRLQPEAIQFVDLRREKGRTDYDVNAKILFQLQGRKLDTAGEGNVIAGYAKLEQIVVLLTKVGGEYRIPSEDYVRLPQAA